MLRVTAKRSSGTRDRRSSSFRGLPGLALIAAGVLTAARRPQADRARPRRRLELRDADAVRAAGGAGRRRVLHRRARPPQFEAQTRSAATIAIAATAAPPPTRPAASPTSGSIAASTSRSLNGRKRTSLVIDPPDGRVPALTAGGARAAGGARRRRPRASGRRPREPVAAGALPGVQRRPADRPRSLQQLPADLPDARRRRHLHRDDPRRAHRLDRRPAARAVGAAPVARRLARPLGGQHAGRRHHQLHRQEPASAARARACTWSSASRAPTRTRCSTSSPSTIRRRSPGRGRRCCR